jgi:sarcosine oxidase
VLGIEQFAPVHDRGSGHGGSRITRQAYFEDPAYVPLLLRAHELWDGIERDTGLDIFTRCGGIMLGRPDSRTVSGSLLSAQKWGLPHELLDAAEIRRRFPTMRPLDEESRCSRRLPGWLCRRPAMRRICSLPTGQARSCTTTRRC